MLSKGLGDVYTIQYVKEVCIFFILAKKNFVLFIRIS